MDYRDQLEMQTLPRDRNRDQLEDWLLWAAWQDAITYEEIEDRTGLNESEVVRWMRKNLSTKTFARWRKRTRTHGL